MAQANEKAIWTETFNAGADLRTHQYKFVKLNANHQVILCGSGEAGCGVLQNAPFTGQEALVCIAGRTPIIMAGLLAAGKLIKSDAAALGVEHTPAAASAHYGMGQLVVGVAGANELAEALICAASPVKADVTAA